MKIADIIVSGRLPPPLTARKRTAVGDSPTAKNSGTVRSFSVEYSSVAVLFRAIKGKGINALSEPLVLMAGLLPPAWNLRTVRAFGLKL